MRALNMMVSDVFANEFSQVRLTQRDNPVEALFFDRADEAFDKGVQVWAATRQATLSRCTLKENPKDICRSSFGTLRDQPLSRSLERSATLVS